MENSNKRALVKLAQVRLAINHVLRQRMIKRADGMEREEALRNDPLVKFITRSEEESGLLHRYPPIIQAQKLREDWARTGQPMLYTPHKNPRMIPPPIIPRNNSGVRIGARYPLRGYPPLLPSDSQSAGNF